MLRWSREQQEKEENKEFKALVQALVNDTIEVGAFLKNLSKITGDDTSEYKTLFEVFQTKKVLI